MHGVSKLIATAAVLGLIISGTSPAQAEQLEDQKSDIAKSLDMISTELLVDSGALAAEASVDQTGPETVVTIEAPSEFAELPMSLGAGTEKIIESAGDVIIEDEDLKTLVNPTESGAQVVPS